MQDAGQFISQRKHFIPALIAAAMLFGALVRWPYGYYTLLRWVTFAAAVFVAYCAYAYAKPWGIWAFIFIAALFNPILPVHLSRQAWQIIDLAAATTFIAAAFNISEPTQSTPVDGGQTDDRE